LQFWFLQMAKHQHAWILGVTTVNAAEKRDQPSVANNFHHGISLRVQEDALAKSQFLKKKSTSMEGGGQ
jgi:hypothetical protein